MTRVPKPGPFDTEREARSAAISLGGPARPGISILSDEQNRQLLAEACKSAGVSVGTYDDRILSWLAGFEDAMCMVIAGLITRAAQRPARRDRHPRLSDAETETVLDALDVAADAKRDAADVCGDCDARPDGALCGTCEWRLARAGEYEALAEALRSQP
jgi:hypothetical protein